MAFFGDTPALNSVLDLLGHTSAAFCHLCRYARGSRTLIGSKYSNIGFNGLHSVFSRVHDCGATQETCRFIGIKTGMDVEDTVLHKLKASRIGARYEISTVAGGKPVVPYQWIPIEPVLWLLIIY